MNAPKVYEAIKNVMHDIGVTGISKGRKNQQQGYQFRGIDDVYNELNSLLSKHGLLMLPRVDRSEQIERQTKSGGALFYTRLEMEFKLVSVEDGSSDIIRTVGEAMDSADKSSNKAQSAAYKYAAMMVFCIPTEGDNDADALTHEVAPIQSPPKPSKNDETRKIFSELVADMKRCDVPADMDAWWKDNECKALRAKLPDDWKADLAESFKEQKQDLIAKMNSDQRQMEGAD